LALTIEDDLMSKPISYDRPRTLDAALALASSADLALAGGVFTLTEVLVRYEHVIDLQDVPELKPIEQRGETLFLGGAVTLQDLIESTLVPGALKRAITRVIPLNMRNGASVGESVLALREPMLREWLAVLVACGAQVELAAPTGVRSTLPMLQVAQTNLPRAIIVGVSVPLARERDVLGAAFVGRTPADQPIVNAAARVRLHEGGQVAEAIAALCGASPEPVVRLELPSLLDSPLSEASIAGAVSAISAAVTPVADYLGSAEYRREMARVTVQRALLGCLAQLGAN
jgi:CO/xanthine dehydrogenase FAD-binding subunit